MDTLISQAAHAALQLWPVLIPFVFLATLAISYRTGYWLGRRLSIAPSPAGSSATKARVGTTRVHELRARDRQAVQRLFNHPIPKES